MSLWFRPGGMAEFREKRYPCPKFMRPFGTGKPLTESLQTVNPLLILFMQDSRCTLAIFGQLNSQFEQRQRNLP